MTTQSSDDADDNNSAIISLTRRQTLKAALALGTATTAVIQTDVERTLAQTVAVSEEQNIHIQTQATGTDGYGNFPNPDTGEYLLYGGDSLMTLSNINTNIDDNTLYAIVELQMNSGDFIKIGETTKPISEIEDGGTFNVSAHDLWGTHSEWNSTENAIDLKALAEDNGIFNSYSDLTIPYDEPTDLTSPIMKETTFTFRYVFQTETLEINEQKEESFTFVTSIHLGFGKSFGVNFGNQHLESTEGFILEHVEP